MSEFQKGLKNGYTRFFLCAEDLGAYGTDTGHTASDLLNKLVNFDSEKEYKIIINEMSPPYLKTAFSDFKEILATGKIESVGCQVESGSSRILKLMGRNYSAEEWRKCMLYINTNFPKVGLTTHFMVGFPTETNEDFEATLKLLDYPLFLKEIAIFKFSASWRVPASRLPKQVPETIKELRYRKLQSKFLHMYTLNTVIGYCGSIIRSLRLQAH
jgi:tRNA A37 methylthiotransferase MiaB